MDFDRTPPVPPPGDYIRDELKQRGWLQEDLARVLGRTLARTNSIITGKQEVSPEIAVALETVFGTPAETWLQREALYRLHLHRQASAGARTGETPADPEIGRRAKLYGMAPVKELQKRGWIKTTDDLNELERELKAFFGTNSLDSPPPISAALRMSDAGMPLSAAQRAWCFRVKQIAAALKVAPFKSERLDRCEAELKKLIAYPQEARKVATCFASYGIRFVVVEPLPGTKIDGAALWLDEDSPVIAVSMRFDRFDAFWFTVAHEMSHIRHRDALSVDSEIVGGEATPDAESEVERRANAEAAATLVPPDQMNSFILRVGPMYSEVRLVQFANRLKVHPGVIVGQLQHRGEIGHHAHRKWLVKVRDTVMSATITDGWGHAIDPRVFE